MEVDSLGSPGINRARGESPISTVFRLAQSHRTPAMKFLIVLCALVAAASAGFIAPAPAVYAHAPAVAVYARPHIGSTQHRAQDTLGQYNYGFSSADGTHKSEGRDVAGNVVGSFGYTSPEGARIETSYVAGAGGFQAVGNAIPQPVGPTPEVAAATYAHLAAKADAIAHTGYVAPAVAAYAHPYAYGHSAAYAHPAAYGHLGYAHHLPVAHGYKFHA